MANLKDQLDSITSEMERVTSAVSEVCARYWEETARPHPCGHDAEWTLSLCVSALQAFQYMLKHGAMPGILDIFHHELLEYADHLYRISAGILESIADVRQEQLQVDLRSTSKLATDLAGKMRQLAGEVAPELAR